MTEIIKDTNTLDNNYDYVNLLNSYGLIVTSSSGILTAQGLNNVASGELVNIVGREVFAIVLNLTPEGVGLILCGSDNSARAMDVVVRTGNLISLPVSFDALGLVINPLGYKLGQQVLYSKTNFRRHLEQVAPSINQRQPIFEPLLTGIAAIDGLVPIGRGQRELIIGDRQTGKTSVAIDAILNQTSVISIYVSVGQKCSSIAQIFSVFVKKKKIKNVIIVAATASDPAPLQYLAPYAGCTLAEFFRNLGYATLVVYDDLTKHATAYRQMSLLLRRPPGREAFPGDVFYLHARLLERACKLSFQFGGGSLTALPIVETQAGDVSAYIPTNVISITDGQLFLDSELFNQGVRPAINAGLSVSRVGSAAQYPVVKGLVGPLKLQLAQYREMLAFTKFGSEMDQETTRLLARGERLVQILKQSNYNPYPIELQVVFFGLASTGIINYINVNKLKKVKLFAVQLVNFINKYALFSPLFTVMKYMNVKDFNEMLILLITFFFQKKKL